MKKYYVVCRLCRSAKVKNNFTGVQELELSWINGQIGAFPVFDNRADAEKFADGGQVLTFVLEK